MAVLVLTVAATACSATSDPVDPVVAGGSTPSATPAVEAGVCEPFGRLVAHWRAEYSAPFTATGPANVATLRHIYRDLADALPAASEELIDRLAVLDLLHEVFADVGIDIDDDDWRDDLAPEIGGTHPQFAAVFPLTVVQNRIPQSAIVPAGDRAALDGCDEAELAAEPGYAFRPLRDGWGGGRARPEARAALLRGWLEQGYIDDDGPAAELDDRVCGSVAGTWAAVDAGGGEATGAWGARPSISCEVGSPVPLTVDVRIGHPRPSADPALGLSTPLGVIAPDIEEPDAGAEDGPPLERWVWHEPDSDVTVEIVLQGPADTDDLEEIIVAVLAPLTAVGATLDVDEMPWQDAESLREFVDLLRDRADPAG